MVTVTKEKNILVTVTKKNIFCPLVTVTMSPSTFCHQTVVTVTKEKNILVTVTGKNIFCPLVTVTMSPSTVHHQTVTVTKR